MNGNIKIQFLGGCEEVGRLAMILELDDVRILFEYGMLPGKPPSYPMQPDPVDIVMLTHAHLDHSGMIPWLFSRYDQKILTTKLLFTNSEIDIFSRLFFITENIVQNFKQSFQLVLATYKNILGH